MQRNVLNNADIQQSQYYEAILLSVHMYNQKNK